MHDFIFSDALQSGLLIVAVSCGILASRVGMRLNTLLRVAALGIVGGAVMLVSLASFRFSESGYSDLYGLLALIMAIATGFGVCLSIWKRSRYGGDASRSEAG